VTKVIVDTSVWVDYFKGRKSKIVEEVRRLIVSNRAVLTGVSLAELLVGTRDGAQRGLLIDALTALDYVEVSDTVWVKAGELGAELNQKGITVPLTDLLIAALSVTHKCEIFTTDKHFNCMPELTTYKVE